MQRNTFCALYYRSITLCYRGGVRSFVKRSPCIARRTRIYLNTHPIEISHHQIDSDKSPARSLQWHPFRCKYQDAREVWNIRITFRGWKQRCKSQTILMFNSFFFFFSSEMIKITKLWKKRAQKLESGIIFSQNSKFPGHGNQGLDFRCAALRVWNFEGGEIAS